MGRAISLGSALQYSCFSRKVWWYHVGRPVGPQRACFSLTVFCDDGCMGGFD